MKKFLLIFVMVLAGLIVASCDMLEEDSASDNGDTNDGTNDGTIPTGDPVTATTSLEVINDGSDITDSLYVVQLDNLPANYQRFTELAAQIEDEPYGAVVLAIATLHILDSHSGEGEKCLKYIDIDGYISDYDFNLILRQIAANPGLTMCYYQGATPSNSYSPTTPYTVKMYMNKYSRIDDKTLKFFIDFEGADSDRPTTARKLDSGIWKAYEYSSIYVGIKSP